MIEQLKTIREFVESVHEGEWLPYVDRANTIAALTQLDAMAGEPVAVVGSGFQLLWCRKDWSKGLKVGDRLYAAPVAQQPQAYDQTALELCAVCGWKTRIPGDCCLICERNKAQQPQKLEDIEQYRMQMAGICTAAIGYWKEGDPIHPDYDTPALRDVAKLYAQYDALYKAQQPQAAKPLAPLEPTTSYVQPVPDHCDRIVWQNPYYHLPLKQPQAEDTIKRQAQRIAELTADRDGWIEAHARLHREYHDFRKAAPQQAEAVSTKFKPGDTVRKTKGSQWHGAVVGTYSTSLTPEGYAVESATEKGSVQIYPASALELWEAPQQAEAVPPGYVLVPVEPDEMWAYQVIRHHQPDLEVGGTAWLECLKEMLHWHAAISQQKGQP